MTIDLNIHAGHEGANPRNAAGIERTGPAAFTVRPESEDGDSNYKFAFDVIVENAAREARRMDLTVDWAEPPEVGTRYMSARASIFFGSGEEWQEIPGRMDGDKVHFALAVPPGRRHACLNPPYGEDRLRSFFERATALPESRRIVFGRTAENRPLEAVALGALSEPRATLLVIGRGHPYETAASFCVDGVLDLLSGPEGSARRRHRAFILAPVMNPDGVAHGLCKRTTLGSDITHDGRDGVDPTSRSVVGLVCGMAASPGAALWDVHGWMNPEDGLNLVTSGKASRVIEGAGTALFPKGWRNTEPAAFDWGDDTPNFRRYAASALGMEVLVTSHPFFGRRPEAMRQVGAAVCRGYLSALDA